MPPDLRTTPRPPVRRGGRAAATAAASAHSTAAARPAPTASQTRRVIAGRATEAAVADAVLSAIGIARPDPASTSGTTTASAAVATVAVTTTPKVAASTATAAVPANADKVSTLTVPRANDVVSTITDFFSGLVGSVQSLVEGVGLLVRRFLFNQAPTVLPVQTSGQTTPAPEHDHRHRQCCRSRGRHHHLLGGPAETRHGEHRFQRQLHLRTHDRPDPAHSPEPTHSPSPQPTPDCTSICWISAVRPARRRDRLGHADHRNPQVGFTFVFGNGWAVLVERGPRRPGDDGDRPFVLLHRHHPVIITYSVTGQQHAHRVHPGVGRQ